MALGASQRTAHSAGRRWSGRERQAWRIGTDWSPSRSSAQRSASRQRAQQEREEQVEQRLAGLSTALSQKDATARCLADEFDIDENRRSALRLKAAISFRASLGPSQPRLIADVDRDISELRLKAHSKQAPHLAAEEALRALVAAQVTLARAETHLLTATERRDAAQQEVARLQTELDNLATPQRAGQPHRLQSHGCALHRAPWTSRAGRWPVPGQKGTH